MPVECPNWLTRGLVALLAMIVASQAKGGTSLCCLEDLNGDGTVAAADLGLLLGAWGSIEPNESADLDHSGLVDASDLGLLLGSWGACPTPCLKTLVVGNVEFADGTPVSDAVVVTDLGGRGVSGADGSFDFVVDSGDETRSLRVTAIAAVRGMTFVGTAIASPVVTDGVTNAGTVVLALESDCEGALDWLPEFGPPGMNGWVNALAVFDDGSGCGPQLYAGGSFTRAGAVEANRIAKWDGVTWSSLGEGPMNGLDDSVKALAVFNDGSGSGPALFVGGAFTNAAGIAAKRIAKWDGKSWSSLGPGTEQGTNGQVSALAVFDNGSGDGPALYLGGTFTIVGSSTANRVASWNGTSWSSLGTDTANGVNGVVRALRVFDDGSGAGPKLYVGGEFSIAGDATANRIAKWDGSSWSSLGTGTANGMNSIVVALTEFDDGSGEGPALYAAGNFTTAGGVPANRIAKWDGASWSSLGVDSANGTNKPVEGLAVFDDRSGDGPALYACGTFTTAGNAAANRIAKWDGASWSALGTGASNGFAETAKTMMVFDSPTDGRASLIVGGDFYTAGDAAASRIAQWDGASWSPVGAAYLNGTGGTVRALAVFDDGLGGGPALYVGGEFNSVGGLLANRVARWDGSSWSLVGDGEVNGVNGNVYTLNVLDDGSGAALYAGGQFTMAGGTPANGIAKWDGTSWSSIGTGSSNGVNGTVGALKVLDLGGGPSLYVGGNFTMAGGTPANRIARWDGTSWSPLGTGSANGVGGPVAVMQDFDDGSGNGTVLYVGGSFLTAGGVTSNRIARWDGASWSPIIVGDSNGINGTVLAMTVFDDGTGAGPELFVGGYFTWAAGTTAYNVAKWNGVSWSALGTGRENAVSDHVLAFLPAKDLASGAPVLYVGGGFPMAGGLTVNGFAKWNGTAWSSVETGREKGVGEGWIMQLSLFDDGTGSGPSLYAGGDFAIAGGVISAHIAKLGCTRSPDDARRQR
jgi:hypothetical protein